MAQHFEKDAHDVPMSDSHKSNDSNVISFHFIPMIPVCLLSFTSTPRPHSPCFKCQSALSSKISLLHNTHTDVQQTSKYQMPFIIGSPPTSAPVQLISPLTSSLIFGSQLLGIKHV